MKLCKPLLVVIFLFWSGLSLALDFNYSCIGKNDNIAPNQKTFTDSDGNTQDTDEWKAWKNSHSNYAISQNWDCCNKLILDGRTCKDPSVVDSTLQSCSNDGSCPSGEGCYPLRDDDLFNADPEDPAAADAAAEKEQKFEQQQNTLGNDDPKTNGSACYRDMECESYKCESFKCVANTICRMAGKGETARGSVSCETPLNKDSATGLCGDSGPNLYVLGLSGINIEQEVGQQCQFKLLANDLNHSAVSRQQLEGIIHTALKGLRAMEWLFSTASGNNHDECQFAMEYMRDGMAGLVNKRKEILKAFNSDILLIENNNTIVNAAKKDDQSMITTVCSNDGANYEMTTAHDVALRKASGKDFFCYMKRRNQLFQAYEIKMKEWLSQVTKLTDDYAKTVFTWPEKEKSWNIAGTQKSYKDRGCRDWTDWHKKIKRRWGKRFKVRGAHTVNTDIIERQGVVPAYLNLFEARGKLNGGKYYLLDPLMPGGWNKGVDFGSYGRGRNLNGDDDRYLKDDSGYRNIYSKFSARLIDFYKSLRLDLPADNYIYEPELVGSYENRGCIDKLNSQDCSSFKNNLSQIQDIAFAQMLLYSHHTVKKYKDYYQNEGTLRRKLFSRYQTDFTNLSMYYEALSGKDGLRNRQNVCLQKLIDQLNGKDFDGKGQGITEGGQNYYNATETSYVEGSGGQKNYIKPKVKTNTGIPMKFSLSSLNISMKGSGLKDTQDNQSGVGSATMADGSRTAMATRIKAMQDANAKATSSGIDVSARDALLREALASTPLSPGGSDSQRSSGTSGQSSTLDSSGANPKDLRKDAANAEKNSDAKSQSASGIKALSSSGGNGGIVGGLGSGANDSQEEGAKGDGTGMSDEEKDVMSSNYERNKSDYKTKEDDSLFQVLSKTYVRSLDKILTRKKKIDEDAEARPKGP